MNFVDTAQVVVKAGAGGAGAVSLRREKFVDKGGPDGGDGGDGGNVVLKASDSENTLAHFRFQKELVAGDGQPGAKSRRHGKSGQDLIVPVPVGTQVIEGKELLADLTAAGQTAVAARGGRGGFGNAHFTSSTRQAPKFAEKGEPGETKKLTFELKMIADVGLVGLPNAGKSTLLARLSNARPEIADYPFTTLTPNLGVVDVQGQTLHAASLLFADIPGLIEGAASGKGLGHEFLRHVERTAVLLHLIDSYQEDIAKAYQTIQKELSEYKISLVDRPQIIVLSKTEGLSGSEIAGLTKRLRKVAPKQKILAISASAGLGLEELKREALAAVKSYRKREPAEDQSSGELPVIRLADADSGFKVSKLADGFRVSGPQIDRFAARTDFSNDQAVARLRDIMKKRGILHELERQGAEPGQTIEFASGHINL